MPRALRIHAPGGFYHVTLRGNHRQRIFFSTADRAVLDSIVADAIDHCEARIHAYCWMTNHVHLLVEISSVPLGRLILRIAGRYARAVQAALATTGHLFERRFHAVLVDADSYLLELVRYIHLNPVRAGLVTDPFDYPWSGHRAYRCAGTSTWMTTGRVLAMFNPDLRSAIDAYERFMMAGSTVRWGVGALATHPDDHRILGGDQFLARTFGAGWQARSRQTLDDLIADCCQQFATTDVALASPNRNRRLAEARAWIGHRAVAARIASVSAVARRLNRNESAIRQLMCRHPSRGPDE